MKLATLTAQRLRHQPWPFSMPAPGSAQNQNQNRSSYPGAPTRGLSLQTFRFWSGERFRWSETTSSVLQELSGPGSVGTGAAVGPGRDAGLGTLVGCGGSRLRGLVSRWGRRGGSSHPWSWTRGLDGPGDPDCLWPGPFGSQICDFVTGSIKTETSLFVSVGFFRSKSQLIWG